MGIVERIEYDPNRSFQIHPVRWIEGVRQRKYKTQEEFAPIKKIAQSACLIMYVFDIRLIRNYEVLSLINRYSSYKKLSILSLALLSLSSLSSSSPVNSHPSPLFSISHSFTIAPSTVHQHRLFVSNHSLQSVKNPFEIKLQISYKRQYVRSQPENQRFLLHMFQCCGMNVEIIVMYSIQYRSYRSGIDNLLILLIGRIPIAMPTVLSVTMTIGSHHPSEHRRKQQPTERLNMTHDVNYENHLTALWTVHLHGRATVNVRDERWCNVKKRDEAWREWLKRVEKA
uniref:Uncharacterized protein n=1 Tax=Cucumis melo TaxID=3656 RepID=A0A9I9EEJ0_CUCME